MRRRNLEEPSAWISPVPAIQSNVSTKRRGVESVRSGADSGRPDTPPGPAGQPRWHARQGPRAKLTLTSRRSSVAHRHGERPRADLLGRPPERIPFLHAPPHRFARLLRLSADRGQIDAEDHAITHPDDA